MVTMQCEKIEEQFSALIEGAIDPAMKLKVEQHLQTCSSCNGQLTELRRVWSMLEDMPEISAPASLHGDIMRNLDLALNDARQQVGFVERLKAFFASNPRSVLAGAAAIILLAIAPMFARNSTEATLSILPSARVTADVHYSTSAVWLSRETGQVQVTISAPAGQTGTARVKVDLIENLPDSVYTTVNSAITTIKPGEMRVVRLTGANTDDLLHYSVMVSTVGANGKSSASKTLTIATPSLP